MKTLWQDLRYGARKLVKSPGFTVVAVLSIALGVGLNTAIFSVMNALLFRPLPVKEPDRLVSVWKRLEDAGPLRPGHSYPDFLDYSRDSEVFAGAVAHDSQSMHLGDLGTAERIRGEMVSATYFDLLGVRPIVGRTLSSEGDDAVLISHRFWQSRFGASADVLGKTVMLNGHRYSIVGVAPPSFKGLVAGPAPDVWIPITAWSKANPSESDLNQRGSRFLYITARLKDGVTSRHASAVIEAHSQRLAREYPNTNSGVTAAVEPVQRAAPRDRARVVPVLGLLLGTVGLILLIACSNVANLLPARAIARLKEIGVRLALGAGRARLVRQLLTESLLLAALGGAVGLLFSLWAPVLIERLVADEVGVVSLDFSPDARVFAFTLAVSMLAGLLFGLLPALRASRTDIITTLKEDGITRRGGLTKSTLRGMLAVSQVALSMLLLIGAGLLTRAMLRAEAIEPGFPTDRLVLLRMDVKLHGYDDAAGPTLFDQLLERVRSSPGVTDVNLAAVIPFGGTYMNTAVQPEGDQGKAPVRTGFNAVSPGHFQTMGIPLIAGRDFSSHDRRGSPSVVIVNEALARELWPGENPIGKRLAGNPSREVVGLAKTIMYRNLGELPQPYFYSPFAQNYRPGMTMVVRTAGEEKAAIAVLRSHVQALDSKLQVGFSILDEQLDGDLRGARLATALFGCFALLALLMALMGVYGVIAHSVSHRTREIGIRMALGATRHDVIRMVVRQGLTLGVIGAAIGIVAAAGATRLLASALYGLSPTDPLTFAVVSVFLLAAVVAAVYAPARRATRVEPIRALRYE